MTIVVDASGTVIHYLVMNKPNRIQVNAELARDLPRYVAPIVDVASAKRALLQLDEMIALGDIRSAARAERLRPRVAALLGD